MANMTMAFTFLDANGVDAWRRHSRIKVLLVEFLSDDAAATASGTTTVPINGRLNRIVNVPHATNPSDALWDLEVQDAYGADLLLGQGLNIANAVDQRIPKTVATNEDSYLETPVNGPLTITAAQCGNANNGIVYLFFRN